MSAKPRKGSIAATLLLLLTKCRLAALQVYVWLGMGMGVAAHTGLVPGHTSAR